MLNISKEETLERLSKIDEVVFVGGTSEYLQGFKKELNDIDISICNTDLLLDFGYVFKSFDNSFHGLSGNRAFIPLPKIRIDCFIDCEKPPYIVVNGFKCQTIKSMIELREKTLLHSSSLSEKSIKKISENLLRLKKIPTN